MNLLDENIRKDQEDLLRTWRVKVRRLSREVAHPGIQDSDILTLLHQLKRSTFFTHDEDFWNHGNTSYIVQRLHHCLRES